MLLFAQHWFVKVLSHVLPLVQLLRLQSRPWNFTMWLEITTLISRSRHSSKQYATCKRYVFKPHTLHHWLIAFWNQTPFCRYKLSKQFSIALDVYLQIRIETSNLVMEALHRDRPDWQLKNACPACTYSLDGEPPFTFKMLFVMDGNDSLKRVSRETLGNDPDSSVSLSSELPGQKLPCSHRYLTRDFVNSFSSNHSEPSLNSAEVRYFAYIA